MWCRHDQNVSHFLLAYFDIIMIKKGYIISKKVSLYDQQISFVLVVAFKGSIAIPKMVYPLETRSGLSLSNKAYLVLIHGWARPSFAFQNLVSPHIIHGGGFTFLHSTLWSCSFRKILKKDENVQNWFFHETESEKCIL